MRCRYCKIALAASRIFVDGEFCCDDHRQRFEMEGPFEPAGSAIAAVTAPVSAALRMLRSKFPPLAPRRENGTPEATEQVTSEQITSEQIRPEHLSDPAVRSGMLTEAPLETEAMPGAEHYVAETDVAETDAENLDSEVFEETAEEPAGEGTDADVVAGPDAARDTAASSHWIYAAWKKAPRDLKLVGVVLPILLFVAVTGTIPKVPQQLAPENLNQVQGQVQQVVVDHWKNLNQSISERAAISYADDFRSGLDAWESRSNLTRSWSYDVAGFVRPGPLAVFKPTVDLTDYRFEFLEELDQKAMGWAFRVEDLNNYYAVKLVVVKPGPLPLVHIVRYAVINGKEGPHVDKPLPMTVRRDMLYRVEVDTRGSDFTILVQGQVVDFWSDSRLRHGGVGFFCNRGERARLRWVEVSHQYDALGRLCAYLAPYGIEGRNGSIN